MFEPQAEEGLKSVSEGAGLFDNDGQQARAVALGRIAEPPQSKRCVFLHRTSANRRPEQR